MDKTVRGFHDFLDVSDSRAVGTGGGLAGTLAATQGVCFQVLGE